MDATEWCLGVVLLTMVAALLYSLSVAGRATRAEQARRARRYAEAYTRAAGGPPPVPPHLVRGDE